MSGAAAQKTSNYWSTRRERYEKDPDSRDRLSEVHKADEERRGGRQGKGADYEIEKVTDVKKIMEYGVMMTPGLVVDGKVVSVGKVLSPEEIKKLLEK